MYQRDLLVALQHRFYTPFMKKSQNPPLNITSEQLRERELFKQYYLTICRAVKKTEKSQISIIQAVKYFEKLVRRNTLTTSVLCRDIFGPKSKLKIFHGFGTMDEATNSATIGEKENRLQFQDTSNMMKISKSDEIDDLVSIFTDKLKPETKPTISNLDPIEDLINKFDSNLVKNSDIKVINNIDKRDTKQAIPKPPVKKESTIVPILVRYFTRLQRKSQHSRPHRYETRFQMKKLQYI
jgi:hypothetical protein